MNNIKIKYKVNLSVLHHIGEINKLQKICKTCICDKIEFVNTDRSTKINPRNKLLVPALTLESFSLKLESCNGINVLTVNMRLS